MTVSEISNPKSSRRLLACLADPGSWTTLQEHRAGFAPPPPPRRAPASELIDVAQRAGLRGRGGASFPTATKMRAVVSGRRRPVVVANGAEGEPASRKDQLLMTEAPHLVVDGALLAAAAVGADEVFFAVVPGEAYRAIKRAAGERFEAEPAAADIHVVQVPDRYIAGEERSVVNFLNGGLAIPTASPPRPFEQGVSGRPTLVQNVETLAHLALISRFGPDWFRAVGTRDAPGTTLITLSGAVGRPGVYEIALGMPLSGLLGAAQGTPNGVAAVLVGGYAGSWLTPAEADAVTLDARGLGVAGGSLGCGAVAVLPSGSCGLRETAGVMRWMAEQTAGQCGPCVHGLAAIAGATDQLARGAGGAAVLSRLKKWAGDVDGRGACRYPDGAIRFLRSALRTFATDVEQHVAGRPCRGQSLPGMLPLPAMEGAA
jgi:NADH:ubiquinone oxidoreductase subunit F (NADH-binding)